MLAVDLSYLKVFLLEDIEEEANGIILLLTQIGVKRDNIEYVKSYSSAIRAFDKRVFDLLIIDIFLGKDRRTGDDFVRYIRRRQFETAVIYLTSYYKEEIYNRVRGTKPHAFMSKDITKLMLRQAVELCFTKKNEMPLNKNTGFPLQMDAEQLFVKVGSTYKTILLAEIDFFSADEGITYIHVGTRQYPISIRLKELEKKLFRNGFARVHRSYLVNIRKIELLHLTDGEINIEGTKIPIGSSYKKQFIERIELLK